MLAEALAYLITPCPGWARRGGYLYGAVALAARHRRCRTAWRPHTETCRRLILEAAARCPERRRVVVLGSGLLAEVPVAELAAGFDEVVLVDAVHLWPVRRQVRRWRHVRLVCHDVTGVVAPLLAGAGAEPTPAWPPPLWAPPADLVVSANLLSQLPLAPLAHLGARRPPVAPATLDRFAAALIRRHLEGLAGVGQMVCLIADLEQRAYDGDHLVACQDLLYGVTLPPADHDWLWTLAPHPEAHPRQDWYRRVGAWILSPDP